MQGVEVSTGGRVSGYADPWHPGNDISTLVGLAGFGEVVAGEHFAADADDGAGEEAVDAVEFAAAFGVGEVVGGAGGGEETDFVLGVVVPVGADEAAEPPAFDGVPAGGVVEEGDLEVDQPGAAVFAVEDVFAFVGVDVGDVAGVDFGEEGGEVVEEGGGEELSGVEVGAGDKFVEEAGAADAAEEAGDAADALEFLVDDHFAASDDPAEPAHGEAVEGVGALDLQDGEAIGAGGGGIFVECGHGEEIVLEEFYEMEACVLFAPPTHRDLRGRGGIAHGEEGGGGALFLRWRIFCGRGRVRCWGGRYFGRRLAHGYSVPSEVLRAGTITVS
jgi:hypothetical protein